jgi:hypothetical protein
MASITTSRNCVLPRVGGIPREIATPLRRLQFKLKPKCPELPKMLI